MWQGWGKEGETDRIKDKKEGKVGTSIHLSFEAFGQGGLLTLEVLHCSIFCFLVSDCDLCNRGLSLFLCN